MVGEEAAEQRSDDGRHAEDRADRPLVLSAVAQRDHIGDQRHRRDHQTARADALQTAPHDQQRHVRREPAEERARDEDDRRDLEDDLPAEQVAELADQHRRHGLREQVRRHHPRHVLGAPEVRDDRGQRGAHDRLVEGGQQNAQNDRREDDVPAARIEQRRCAGNLRGGGGLAGSGHLCTFTPPHVTRMREAAGRVSPADPSATPSSARRTPPAPGHPPGPARDTD